MNSIERLKKDLKAYAEMQGKPDFKYLAEKYNVSWQTVVGLYTNYKVVKEINKQNLPIKASIKQDIHLPDEFANSLEGKKVIKVTYIAGSPAPFKGGDPKNVLVIGDTHEPFCKEGYLEFCREMQEKYNCGTVVHIGDLTDNHAISYHESDPSGKSAGDEYLSAIDNCKRWYHTFPEVKVCIGNHDALPFRKAFTAGLPAHWLKSYQELLESPKTWKWDFVHEIEGVIYQHGTGMSGEMASVNAARENRQSTVIGHLHTVCNARFLASHKDLIFGLTVGCGIDHKSYAFAYGKEQTRKPVVSCAVVLNGSTPINIPMNYNKQK